MTIEFNIEGRHIEITPALEEYIINKLGKIDKIFSNRVTHVHVILSIEKFEQTAEAEIKIAGDKNTIFAEATSKDMYESIDKLEDRLYSQVTKYHGKLTNHDHDEH